MRSNRSTPKALNPTKDAASARKIIQNSHGARALTTVTEDSAGLMTWEAGFSLTSSIADRPGR